MPNFLFITGNYPPIGRTGSIRPYKLCKYFEKFGWTPIVLTIAPASANLPTNATVKDLNQNVLVKRVPLMKTKIINDEGVRWHKKAWNVLKTLIPKHDIKIVIITGSPFFSFFLGLKAKKRFGIPFILDYRDLWFGDPYPARTIKDWIFRRIGYFFETQLINESAFTNFISYNMMNDQLRLFPKIQKDRCKVISTGFDPEDFTERQSIEKPEIIKNFQKKGFVVFSHIGTLDTYMNEMDFCKLLKNLELSISEMKTKCKILLIGRNNAGILRFAEKLNVSDFFFDLGFLPQQECQKYMKHSDVLLALASCHKQRLNRKIFEYLASKKPILYLGHPEGAGAMVLKKTGGAIIVDIRDLQSAKKGFVSIYDMVTNRTSIAINEEKLNEYSHVRLSKQFVELFNQVTQTKESTENQQCLLCGTRLNKKTVQINKENYVLTLTNCKFCNLLQQCKIREELISGSIYDSRYNDRSESIEESNYLEYTTPDWYAWDESIFESIKRNFPEPNREHRLLDVGCGWGRLLCAAKKYGWEAIGLEMTDVAIKYINSNHPNITVLNTTAEQCGFKDNEFDVITLFEVIEHVSNPQTIFKELYRMLKPGGILVVQTGDRLSPIARLKNGSWPYFKDEHIAYYSKKTIYYALQKIGFSNILIKNGTFLNIRETLHFIKNNGFVGPYIGNTLKQLLKIFLKGFFSTTLHAVARKP